MAGLFLSQAIPYLGFKWPAWWEATRHFLTTSLLGYIMIEVGREFRIERRHLKRYAVDYGVAASAAAFPWILCTLYFLLFLMPETSGSGRPLWIEALLAGRFAAPTSAGVLFSMLAAAGLAQTWVYKKTRLLAIFDDLDTVLLMIPLQMLIVGMAWQLGASVALTLGILVLGLFFYRRLRWPANWPWVLVYAFGLAAASEVLRALTHSADTGVSVHLEILLPAFLLGLALRPAHGARPIVPGEDAPGESPEENAGLAISGAFLFLVGLSMPPTHDGQSLANDGLPPLELAGHVLAVTVLANLGKMVPLLCYRNEATWRERLAVSVAMFPRGEVGAGVLAVSLAYGISGPFVTVGFLSLALNLVLTGAFIYVVRILLNGDVKLQQVA